MVIPNVYRTWALRGVTPILEHSYRRDRVSAISAITVSPRRRRVGLAFQLFPRNITGLEVVGFLRNFLRDYPGNIELLWDEGTIHKRVIVREFLQRRPRVHVHSFPTYAPELNPDEFIWNRSKKTLANFCPQTLDELGFKVRETLLKISRSEHALRSCVKQSELPWRW